MLQTLDITYPGFDVQKSENYKLSIRFAPDGFSFIIYDFFSEKFILLKHHPISKYADWITDSINLVQDSEILKTKFREIHIVIDVPASVSVPKTFFHPDKIVEIYTFSSPIRNDDELLSFYSEKNESILISSVPDRIINFVSDYFFQPDIITSAFFDINLFFEEINNEDNEIIIASVSHRHLNILAGKKQKIELINSFEISGNTDITYFILLIIQQLGLDQNEIKLILKGNLELNSDAVRMLKEYIRNVSFLTWPSDKNFYPPFFDVTPHYYSELFRL